MTGIRKSFVPMYWGFTLAAFIVTCAMVIFFTPYEATMGVIQKIFYIHLPVAICTFLAAIVVFIASIGYLLQRKLWWDDLASSAGRVTVLLCTIVLLTGMIWAKSAWGYWWTWSPRLTFSLILWLLYVVYVLIRPSIDSPQRRAMVCAVYGLVAFIDVPLVYLSTKLMLDIHPKRIVLDAAMQRTLLLWFVPIVLLTIGLIVSKYKLSVRTRALADQNSRVEAEVVSGVPAGGVQ